MHTDGTPQDQAISQVDPRLIFLLGASIRFDLVERGELPLDQAFSDLMSAFASILEAAA